MPNPFSITAATDTVRLDAQGRGAITYTVSNVSRQLQRGRARLVPSDPGQASWLSVDGEAERNFPADGTHQYTVRVAVPPGTPPGRSMFGMDVISVENPDEEWSQGPKVAFEVPAPAAKRPFPWWILAVVAGVLLVGGLIAWLASRDRHVEPVVESEPVADPATPRPLVLKAAGDPARVAQDQPTRIAVWVGADGSAVAGADVKLAAGGGAFANGATQIAGQTDATGSFSTAWSCSPCAPAYGIDVEASKAGYQPATGSVTIAVGEAVTAAGPETKCYVADVTVGANTFPHRACFTYTPDQSSCKAEYRYMVDTTQPPYNTTVKECTRQRAKFSGSHTDGYSFDMEVDFDALTGSFHDTLKQEGTFKLRPTSNDPL